MLKATKILITAAALLWVAVAAQADVYSYVDEHGNKQLTDKPPVLPAQRLKIQSRTTDTVEAGKRAATENKQLGDEDKGRQTSQRQQQDQREAKEINEKDKAERCVKARERYETTMNSRRLYTTNDKQEREYLSDAEIDAARQNAKQSMDELCK